MYIKNIYKTYINLSIRLLVYIIVLKLLHILYVFNIYYLLT